MFPPLMKLSGSEKTGTKLIITPNMNVIRFRESELSSLELQFLSLPQTPVSAPISGVAPTL